MRTVASIRVVGKTDLTYEFLPISFWAFVTLPLCPQNPLTPPSDAEIAFGIIVGCMPVMAKFSRLSIPQIRSRLSSYLRTKKTTTKVSSAAKSPWSDPYDISRPLDDVDLELSTYSLGMGSDAVGARSSDPGQVRTLSSRGLCREPGGRD